MDAAKLKAALEKLEPAVSWFRETSTAPSFQASRAIVDSQALLIAYEAAEAQLKSIEGE